MGFENSYSSETYYDESRVPGGKSTILPFFGFSYKKMDGGYFESYGGGVTITDKGGGTYEAKQNRTYYSWKSTSWRAVFTREAPPTGKLKELEDRFFPYIEFEKIFSTQYIPISVSDYYDRYVCRPGDAESRSFRIGCLPFWISTLVLIIFGLYTNFAEIHLEKFPLFIIIPFVLSFPFCFIASSIIQKKLEYKSLSLEKKQDIREQYFAYMKKQYGEKAGEILQEYAKLKGYDRI